MRLLLGLALCCTVAVGAGADTKPGWIPVTGDPVPDQGCPQMAPSDLCDGSVSLGPDPTAIVGWNSANLGSNYNAGAGNTCTGYSSNGPDGAYAVDLSDGCTINLSLESDPPDVPGGPPGWDRSLYFVTDCNSIAGTCLCGSDATYPGGPQGPEACSYTNTSGGVISGHVVVDGFGSTSSGPYCLDVQTSCPPVPVEETSWGQIKVIYE